MRRDINLLFLDLSRAFWLVGILPSHETMGSTLRLLVFSGVFLYANSGVAVFPATAATMVSWRRG